MYPYKIEKKGEKYFVFKGGERLPISYPNQQTAENVAEKLNKRVFHFEENEPVNFSLILILFIFGGFGLLTFWLFSYVFH